MKSRKYDIFITYRRDRGAQYARTLQLMLEKKGYRVFLDYDELKDSMFSPQIEAAIRNSTIQVIVLTEGSMARCANEGDWVRREIEVALENGKRIVPVNPDNTYDGMPDDVPEHIRSAIQDTQHSEVNFGQALKPTVDLMVKNRIKPYVRHTSWHRWLWIGIVVCVVAAVAGIVWHNKRIQDIQELETLKQEVTLDGTEIPWPEDITKEELLVIKEIFDGMQAIEGGEFMQGASPLPDGTYHENVETEYETPARPVKVGPFLLSKYEVTRRQWNVIMHDNRGGDPDLPIDSVSFDLAKAFAARLFEITGQDFRLPTEEEWEYAAKGGDKPEGFMFAGSDNPADVAWHAGNSGGRSHAELPATPTVNDIFNMSGNVSEWCDSEFLPYDDNVMISDQKMMVVRGGNYDSAEYELTTTHREPARPDTAIPTLGFRVAVRK